MNCFFKENNKLHSFICGWTVSLRKTINSTVTKVQRLIIPTDSYRTTDFSLASLRCSGNLIKHFYSENKSQSSTELITFRPPSRTSTVVNNTAVAFNVLYFALRVIWVYDTVGAQSQINSIRASRSAPGPRPNLTWPFCEHTEDKHQNTTRLRHCGFCETQKEKLRCIFTQLSFIWHFIVTTCQKAIIWLQKTRNKVNVD